MGSENAFFSKAVVSRVLLVPPPTCLSRQELCPLVSQVRRTGQSGHGAPSSHGSQGPGSELGHCLLPSTRAWTTQALDGSRGPFLASLSSPHV